MALKLNERYPGRTDPASIDYPQGSFKNRSSPTAKDGTYLEKDWANDDQGFKQSLLSAAGVTANGQVDKVGSSQYFDALKKVIKNESPTPSQATESVAGVAKIATQAKVNAGTDDFDFVTSKKLKNSIVASVYPNGGSKSSPASVSLNSSYFVDNPFPGFQVLCVCYVQYNGIWASTQFINAYNSGTLSSDGYGVKAEGRSDGKIRVLTGNFSLIAPGGHDVSARVTTPVPCVISVLKGDSL